MEAGNEREPIAMCRLLLRRSRQLREREGRGLSIHFKPPSKPCYVYIIDIDAPVHVPPGERYRHDIFKVGITDSPISRLASIKTGCPFPLHMIARRLPSREIARNIEHAFHEANAEWRLEGEWFWYIRTGACDEIDTLVSGYWFDRNGFSGLKGFLLWSGMSADYADDHIGANYGAEEESA